MLYAKRVLRLPQMCNGTSLRNFGCLNAPFGLSTSHQPKLKCIRIIAARSPQIASSSWQLARKGRKTSRFSKQHLAISQERLASQPLALSQNHTIGGTAPNCVAQTLLSV